MLGSYALPKTLLRIEVMGDVPDPAQAMTALTALEEISVTDANRVYCLDHLSSPSAKDDIKVIRGIPPQTNTPPRTVQTSTNLLTYLSSNTIDYTADILRKIVRAIFIGISGQSDFKPVARSLKLTSSPLIYKLANFTFDPFDTQDLLRTNRELRPLGFCVLLELGDVDTVAREGTRFCSNPGYLRQARARFDDAFAIYDQAADLPARVPGIVYRPRQQYRLYVYANDDPKGGSTWNLVQTMHVKMENISPVVSVGVDRAIFSARRTALVFDRGVLVNMCVSKRSELLAVAEIPLEVVRSIVALPAAIITVRIDEVTKSRELMGVERDLIRLQRQYIEYLADPNKTPPTYGTGKDGSIFPAAPAVAVFDPAFVDEATRQAKDDDFGQICAQPGPAKVVATTGTTGQN
jgi:hypothetical protein